MLQLDKNYRITLDSSRQNFLLERLSEIKERDTGNVKYEYVTTGFHGLSLRSVLHSYKK
jgi:hypothetical protein